MYDAIKNLNKQFAYEPEIKNPENWKRHDKFLVAGMGGSHLAADLIGAAEPLIDLTVHQDYGLPSAMSDAQAGRLVILSSYSGNTEEILDAYDKAKEQGLPIAAVSIGGKLLEAAKKDGAPFVQIPDTGIQPRSAVGYMFRAFLKIMGQEDMLRESEKLAGEFKPTNLENNGIELAEKINGRVPVIYTSVRNEALAKNWRVRFHETAKVPAYYNVFPELNHNEMNGFDAINSTRPLLDKFHFIVLRDADDNPRILKRMEITAKLYRDRGLPVEIIDIAGKSRLHKIFYAISLADWTAFYAAKHYGTDPEEVPMVEEMKKLIA